MGPRFKSFGPPQADLQFVTHKEDRIRREIPHCGEIQRRRDTCPPQED